MSVELLYTSAPNGLKQGSRGFCTVLSTQGMPVNLASRLELLSGYRHIFPPQDAQANLNPVAWSHVSLTMAGQVTSILSRIAAYGVDYSGRTNKLAHHVVVGPSERIAAGPAWLLQSPGLMRSEWGGVCETPASGPPIVQANQTARVCETWKSLTGDAGWGGVVAEALVAPAGKPLWVIYRLDQQRSLLELMNESIALLPESQRWQATFSTYYTNLPPEVDCKVRFVVEGTEEASKLASRGSSILLAPGVPLTIASAFVESARTGASIAVPAPAAPATRPAAPTSRPAATIDIESMWDEPENTPLHRTSKVLPPSATLATSLPESPPAIATPPKFKGTVPPAISSRQRNGSKVKIAAMVGVPLILLASVATAWAIFSKPKEVELANARVWPSEPNEASIPTPSPDAPVDEQTSDSTKQAGHQNSPVIPVGSEASGPTDEQRESRESEPNPADVGDGFDEAEGAQRTEEPAIPHGGHAEGPGREETPVASVAGSEQLRSQGMATEASKNPAEVSSGGAPDESKAFPEVLEMKIELAVAAGDINLTKHQAKFSTFSLARIGENFAVPNEDWAIDTVEATEVSLGDAGSNVDTVIRSRGKSPSEFVFYSPPGPTNEGVNVGVSKSDKSLLLHLSPASGINEPQSPIAVINKILQELQAAFKDIPELHSSTIKSQANAFRGLRIDGNSHIIERQNAPWRAKHLFEAFESTSIAYKKIEDVLREKKKLIDSRPIESTQKLRMEFHTLEQHNSVVATLMQKLGQCITVLNRLNSSPPLSFEAIPLIAKTSSQEPKPTKIHITAKLKFDFPDADKQGAE